MTETIDVTLGMNQPFMTQINFLSKSRFQTLKPNPQRLQIYHNPFKVQYANAELEQPLATYTLRFKIGDYTFEETFIIMNQHRSLKSD